MYTVKELILRAESIHWEKTFQFYFLGDILLAVSLGFTFEDSTYLDRKYLEKIPEISKMHNLILPSGAIIYIAFSLCLQLLAFTLY